MNIRRQRVQAPRTRKYFKHNHRRNNFQSEVTDAYTHTRRFQNTNYTGQEKKISPGQNNQKVKCEVKRKNIKSNKGMKPNNIPRQIY